MRDKAKILIVKSGTTNPPVVAAHGDYDFWFQKSLSAHAIQWVVVSVYLGEPLPDPADFDGIILTGSPESVWEGAPWMRRTADWLGHIVHRSTTPVLGVCFGHQLLGWALGGEVCPNPNGGEVGTIQVDLNAAGQADYLFQGLPNPIVVQSIHNDIVMELPETDGLMRLGGTANTSLQAFAIGSNIRAVQFHPELSASALSMLCVERAIEATVRECHHGDVILENWFLYVSNRA